MYNKLVGVAGCGWLCVVLGCVVCAAGCEKVAMTAETPSWYVFSPKGQHGPCGYVGRNGKVLVPARLSYAQPFSGNTALVTCGGVPDDAWAYIDREGKLVATVQTKGSPFLSDGMILFEYDDGLFGYVDIGNGPVMDPEMDVAEYRMIEPEFSDAEGFSCGLAAVTRPEDLASGILAGRYIDKSGKNAFPGLYHSGKPFSEGFACVRSAVSPTGHTRTNKWHYIDAKGQRVGTMEFDEASEFHEGLAAVKVDGKYGYINTRGEWQIKPRFKSAGQFSEGLAAIDLPDSPDACYIDKSGKVAIRGEFAADRPFSEGLAFVWLELADDWRASVGGFIDHTGKVRIRLERCDNAGHFENGLCPVRIDGTVVVIDKEGKVRVRAPKGCELHCYFPGED